MTPVLTVVKNYFKNQPLLVEDLQTLNVFLTNETLPLFNTISESLKEPNKFVERNNAREDTEMSLKVIKSKPKGSQTSNEDNHVTWGEGIKHILQDSKTTNTFSEKINVEEYNYTKLDTATLIDLELADNLINCYVFVYKNGTKNCRF